MRGRIDASIAVVISNRPEAKGLDAARARGINAVCIPSQGIEREAYDRLVVAELKKNAVDLVCLAGFMRLLSAYFVREFPLRVLNIHPALLPSFAGLDAQHQAIEHGVKISGCTVHFVDEEPRLRADPGASGGAGARRRHGGDALGANPEGGAPHLQRGHPHRALGEFRIEGRRVLRR